MQAPAPTAAQLQLESLCFGDIKSKDFFDFHRPTLVL
jgi:hypothetical protein